MNDRLLRDERWDRLAAGTLTAKEEIELKALAASSPEAMEAYVAFKPLGPDFQARVVSAINSQWESEALRKVARTMNSEETADLVRRALAGDQTALNRLVAKLTPVIHARVSRTLLARRSFLANRRDLRQDIEDQTQEVFLKLFARDGHVLRSWQAERGLSLENFVGLVAKRQAISFLRRLWPWKGDSPLAEDEIDIVAPCRDPEVVAESRELLSCLLDRLHEKLSPLGWQLFQLLFVQDLSPAEVQKKTGLSAVAVYAWRSRLPRLARKLQAEMSEN